MSGFFGEDSGMQVGFLWGPDTPYAMPGSPAELARGDEVSDDYWGSYVEERDVVLGGVQKAVTNSTPPAESGQ